MLSPCASASRYRAEYEEGRDILTPSPGSLVTPRPASPTKNSPICSQRWPSLKAELSFPRSPPATSIWPPSPVCCTSEASLASISSSLSQRTRLHLNPIKTIEYDFLPNRSSTIRSMLCTDSKSIYPKPSIWSTKRVSAALCFDLTEFNSFLGPFLERIPST
ncbi:unnamed protein product [Gulo gulo]|uniref:Uncharacterized protein n=1 Tax=Gulo gulo TaxID=48420 RepID=A0A9X9LVD9_GULGU|nr:unnamed protein product [Gulo gulo]